MASRWAPFFRTSGVLVRADGGAIDVMRVPIQVACRIGLLLQDAQNLLPQTALPPAIKPTGHAAPGPEAGGQITPRRSRPDYPQHAFHHPSMVVIRSSRLWFARWQERFEPLPLLIR
jgi:hypothetical protein